LLSEITFGSFLVYAPRGTNEVSRRAQQFVRALKEERFIGAPPQSPILTLLPIKDARPFLVILSREDGEGSQDAMTGVRRTSTR